MFSLRKPVAYGVVNLLLRNQETKIPCNVHNTMMFSAYNQELPTKNKHIVHLYCIECYNGTGNGYRLKGVLGDYYLKHDASHLQKMPTDKIEKEEVFKREVDLIGDFFDEKQEIVKPLKRRGRPPKHDKALSDQQSETTPSTVTQQPEKKKRGRPKKEKQELTPEQQKLLEEAKKLLGK